MSSGPKHKMYDFEVAPPPGTWARIEAELDEAELSQKFPAALYRYEVTPPVAAWQKIAAALDQPALVKDYAGKLAGLEVIPPAAAWDKIKAALEPSPVQRRITPWFKYAAAAAVIALVAWGGIRLVSDKNNATGIATIDSSSDKIPVTIPAQDREDLAPVPNTGMAVTTDPVVEEEARNDAALEQSKRTYAKLETNRKQSKIRNAASFFFVSDEYDYSSSSTTGTSRGIEMYEESIAETPVVDMANRYIVLMTPDGNIIRMSRKFGNLVCCVSGEEVDKECKDQMQKWREKIASPAATHTPGNFIDLLQMLNALQEGDD